MGFILFIFGFGLVTFFIFIVLGILGLFFGGEDPYERELAEWERHDELMEAILDQYPYEPRSSINVLDARSIHFHNYNKETVITPDKYNLKHVDEIIQIENKETASFDTKNIENKEAASLDTKNKDYLMHLNIGGLNSHKNKLKKCFEILNKYAEINDKVKDYFTNNEIAQKLYIRPYFGRNFNINDIICKLQYPDIHFGIVNNKVHFWAQYNQTIFNKKLMLTVEFKENFKIIESPIEEGFEKYDESTEIYIDELEEHISQLLDTIIAPIFNRAERQLKKGGIKCEQFRRKDDNVEAIEFSVKVNNKELTFGLTFCYRGYNTKDRKQVLLVDDIFGYDYFNLDEITNEFVLSNFNKFLSKFGILIESKISI